ncbi:uncharacterized protein LOC126253655 [Schistocerca nitens]|uniref:uncharacterized protein LOC126253655 n=1 Tax=Schistocerca nitens TaxID=7011 RepID=UPI00211979FC|nr:uncharacterized protein LOC126253655 [Schistocerca nitens]
MKANNYFYFVCILLSVLDSFMCSASNGIEFIENKHQSLKDSPSYLLSVSEDPHNFQRYLNFRGILLDQTPSSSELLGPSIDLDYTHLQEDTSGKQSHGISSDSRGFYNENDAARATGRLGFFGSSAKQGASGHMSEHAYDGLQRRVHHDSSDRNFYNGISGAHADRRFGGLYNGGHELKQKGLAAAAVGSNGSHRKGHHSSGFHNSYHKDESGNNTTFYDDSADFGGHFFLGSEDGSYMNQADELYGGNYNHGAFKDQVKGRQSNYGLSNAYDAVNGHKQNYGQGRFFDNAAGYAEEEQVKNNERALFTGRNGDSKTYHGANRNHEQLYGGGLKPKFHPTLDEPEHRNSFSSEKRNYYPADGRTYALRKRPSDSLSDYGIDDGARQYSKQYESSASKYLKPQTSAEIGYYGTYRGITY